GGPPSRRGAKRSSAGSASRAAPAANERGDDGQQAQAEDRRARVAAGLERAARGAALVGLVRGPEVADGDGHRALERRERADVAGAVGRGDADLVEDAVRE